MALATDHADRVPNETLRDEWAERNVSMTLRQLRNEFSVAG